MLRIMKKLSFILTLSTAIFMSSCSDEDGLDTSALVDEIDLSTDASLESNYEDVDLITEAGMETIEIDGGRTERDLLLECAEVIHDEENQTVTIDYGDGCEGPNGRIRRGQVIIEYNERRLIPGAFRRVTLQDFSVDNVLIEGTRTVTNVSESITDSPSFEITLVGGKVTFEDETTATRDASRTRTWFRASNPLADETSVEGGSSGTRRDGASYSVEILERLVYKRGCRVARVFIPVSGIKQITSGDNVAIINYGDGECDRLVTVTINGETTIETIDTRR